MTNGTPVDIQPGDFLLTFAGRDGWVMRITHDGKLQFNREFFTSLSEDQFAEKVVNILETHFRFSRVYDHD